MSALLTGVTDRVKRLVPNYGSRWTDALIQSVVHLADAAVREEAETVWKSHDITLNGGALWYSLPNDVVTVESVMYSIDGTDFDKPLYPAAFAELDRMSYSWNDDTGISPTYYSLWCAPGTSDYSRIMIWPAVSAATAEKIRVNYLGAYSDEGALAAVDVPDWVQDRVYVPFVLGVLLRLEDPDRAEDHMAEFYGRLPEVYAAYRVRRSDQLVSLGEWH